MSLSRSEQARINGAKSRGPITPEGKSIAAMNAFKHGRYSKPSPVLRTEDESAFRQLLADYQAHLAPQSPIELRLVHEIASADWQLARWRTIETAQIDRLYALRRPAHSDPDPFATLTAALEASVNESRLLPFIAVRIGRLLAERNSALRTLRTLRRSCPLPAAMPQAAADQAHASDNSVQTNHSEKQPQPTDSKPLTSPSTSLERTQIERRQLPLPHTPLSLSAPHPPKPHPHQQRPS